MSVEVAIAELQQLLMSASSNKKGAKAPGFYKLASNIIPNLKEWSPVDYEKRIGQRDDLFSLPSAKWQSIEWTIDTD